MGETKKCKYCQTVIPKTAKICPNCRKKQGPKIWLWIIVIILVIGVLGALFGSGGDEESGTDSNPKKTNTSEEKTESKEKKDSDNAKKEEEKSKEKEDKTSFKVGDVVEISDAKATYQSAEPYTSDNEFIQPDEGKGYYCLKFEFENTGDSDFTATSFDFEGYADGYNVEQEYLDDANTSVDLSPGKKGNLAVYFSVPNDAKKFIVEYEPNVWTQDKIEFVVK